ncbi:MAG: hypothetical protein OHK0015_27960 [Chloroflexi bacterium OHK40]
MNTPTIGHEEWAVELEARRDWRRDRWGWLQHQARQAPSAALVGLPLALALALALLFGNDYILRVAGTACIYGVLAMGLTLVVGQAGLLDLGYVAYFGVGAYAYALLASPQLGLHTPIWLALPAAIGAAMAAGLLLGVPGLRLNDDYLGIVTLGFGQVIVLLALKLDRLALPWAGATLDLTGGPNGILGIDPPRLLGWAPATQGHWLLVLAATLLAVLALASRVVDAPLGQAWRALREDPLAAAAMGLPVTRLRLLAVSSGAAIAGLAGALFAGWQGAIFPVNLDLSLLLTLYAAILIGGLGSLPGALVGAALLAALPEILRDPALGRALVYGGGALALILWRRWPGAALLAAGGCGIAIAASLATQADVTLAGNLALVALPIVLAALPLVRRPWQRLGLQAFTLVLATFAWETRLAAEPGLARPLLLGVALIAMLIVRPHGLFGRQRVTVV